MLQLLSKLPGLLEHVKLMNGKHPDRIVIMKSCVEILVLNMVDLAVAE